MAQRILNKINSFSQNQLIEFLKNNGYDEFENILINGGITDGKQFLEINELQVQKWRLQRGTKMKLLSFLEEVKLNPQKYYEIVANEKNTAPQRRQSFLNTNNTGFIKELQQIIVPKPPEIKPITNSVPATRNRETPTSRKPLPAPPPLEDSEPLEEYLDMDQGRKQTDLGVELEAHYDADGYLTPINGNKNEEEEENDYEPPPSTPKVTNFLHRNPAQISHRPPLAVPRGSTDERGYILGPEGPRALLPRIQNKNDVRSNVHKTQPKFDLPPKITVQDEEEAEVSYEPIDDYEPSDTGSSHSMTSLHSMTTEDTGTLTKFFGLFKKNRKAEPNLEPEFITNSLERKNQNKKTTTDFSSSLSRSFEKDFSIRDRPLPPLPSRQQIFHTQTSGPVEDFLTRVYENTPNPTEKLEISAPRSPKSPALKVGKRTPKSSSSDENIHYVNSHVAAEEESGMTYENLNSGENKKPKFPESYEMYTPKSKSSKRPLPLPPKNILPQIPLDPNLIHGDVHEEEDDDACLEDYDCCVFNLNNEPFYRNTDRKGARQYLQELEEGAFLFRPSKKFFLTLSLKYNNKYVNLGIDKTSNNRIRLFTEDSISPEFATLDEFVKHFTRNILTFRHQGATAGVYLKPVLSQY